MTESTVGYDSRLFVEKPPEGYHCPLCFNVLKDLRQCPNGHCCCSGCFVEALERRPECPICKTHVTFSTLSRNLFLENVIRDLKMICISCEETNGEDKCLWTGPAAARQTHFENDCGFYKLKCPNLRCNELVPRKQLFEHLTTTCSTRSVQCADCQTTLFFREVEPHKLVCFERLVDCPNACGLRSTFRQINQHCEIDCPLQTVDCPLFKLGVCRDKCKGVMLRSSIADHTSQRVERIKASLERETQSATDIKEWTAKNEQLLTELITLTACGPSLDANRVDSAHEKAVMPTIFSNSTASNDSKSQQQLLQESDDERSDYEFRYVVVNWKKFIASFTELFNEYWPANGEVTLQCCKKILEKCSLSVELSLLDAIFGMSGCIETELYSVPFRSFCNTVRDMILDCDEDRDFIKPIYDEHTSYTLTVTIEESYRIGLILTELPTEWKNYDALRIYLEVRAKTQNTALCVMDMIQLMEKSTRTVAPQQLHDRILKCIGKLYMRALCDDSSLYASEENMKKYVTVSWQKVVRAVYDVVMERVTKGAPAGFKGNPTQNNTFVASMLWDALISIHKMESAEQGSLHDDVFTTLALHFADFSKTFPYELEPTAAHSQNEVTRVVIPSDDGYSETFVICLVDVKPEWRTFDTLKRYVDIARFAPPVDLTLSGLMLNCVTHMVCYQQCTQHNKLAGAFATITSKIPNVLSCTEIEKKTQWLLGASSALAPWVGKPAEYRNKKLKWVLGIMQCLDVEANSCIVLNHSNENVTVKLSHSARMPEYVWPKHLTSLERFTLLKVGGRIEMKNRTTGSWTEVTIKSVDSGDKLTCVVETDKNKVMSGVHISELREVL